ncbi:hypothetical protein [Chryseolinea soli]|uniref:Uncharacterized protein n=1 Tax=Chryseolinea soli TaxID=2321403 RepID=A0A385SGI9_9BACT|nr:hypothetical protein [Chryseolinea soli]AYB29992.1 hypothetical protein D4L85_05095 [Chryseolinea soli]
MVTEEELISETKSQIEKKLGWGDSRDWTNQDFLELSQKIQDELQIAVSHVTLKRIWGKVKYTSLPNTFTLNTLVQFIGYENWRDFKVKNGGTTSGVAGSPTPSQAPRSKGKKPMRPLVTLAIGLVLGYFIWFGTGSKKEIDANDYSLQVKKTVEKGVPNSVIFDYDATNAPVDSVILQQSWDVKRRTKVSKDAHQRTLIYYLPGYFEAKLVVDEKIVKEQGILIASDGWLAAIDASPMPVYFKKEDVMVNGQMSLSIDKLQRQNIHLAPQPPLVSYLNVQDFGAIYSDNFVFEASLKNDYKEGAAICQKTNIYLLCEGMAVGIPLCTKGCVSDMSLFFTGFDAPGKQVDLSAFGVDFDEFVRVRVESAKGKAKIFLNQKLAFEIDHDIARSKIIGIDFVFQGTGNVDYVKLENETVKFEDGF